MQLIRRSGYMNVPRLGIRNLNLHPRRLNLHSRRGVANRLGLAFVILVGIVGGALASPAPLLAQEKYDPEDEVVSEMIRKAMGYIEIESNQSDLVGHRVMYAIAAYKANVLLSSDDPKNHILITQALEKINTVTSETLDRSMQFDTMYAGALACILLLELDAEKYQPQIEMFLEHIRKRQLDTGAWGYRSSTIVGDTSQMQYIALALWLAKQHGYPVDTQMCREALDWMVEYQMPDGGWIYKQPQGIDPSVGDGARTVRHSLVAAGLGTVYLYADILQLFERQMQAVNTLRAETELPKAVIDITNETEAQAQQGALVNYNLSELRGTMNKGNSWFRSNFAVETEQYNLYYLYGFERYVSLRRYLDGQLSSGSGVATWYDEGVDFLREIQQPDGSFASGDADIGDDVNTAFGILFLTQSMSLTLGDSARGLQTGFQGFPEDTVLAKKGDRIVKSKLQKSISEFLSLMGTSDSEELAAFGASLTELNLNDEGVSRNEALQQMRFLVKHENYQARLVAVKYISRQRSLDNVPALIFALSDPDPQVARAANEGMRFVSRKTKGPQMDEEPAFDQKKAAIRYWTDWYKRIKPDGQLLDLPEEFVD